MQQQQQQHESSSSRGALRNTSGGGGGAGAGGGGVIVEVQGGHIVRATGRKDRHSKVCTAKGPRDRRVRLSAHTAIQFYDVQDRLGYDRPSKAVDWLIKKAKASIDELAELPAWNPTTGSISTNTLCASLSSRAQQEQEQEHQHQVGDYAVQQHQHEQIETGSGTNTRNNGGNNQSFIPSSLDSDAIADTIKSFFPMGASNDHHNQHQHQHHHHQAAPSNQMHFHQSYTPDLLSSNHNQDLRLSLHSFQDPMLIQSHHHQHNHQGEAHGMFSSGGNALGFDSSPSAAWNEHHQHQHQQPGEMGRFQRMIAWNGGGADTDPNGGGEGGGGGGGFMFNPPQSPPQQQPFLQQLFGQSQFFSQRGPLQSSNTSSIRAWIDSPLNNHQQLHNHHPEATSIHPSTMSGIGGYTAGDFSGFRIPARIQGDQEQEERGNGISNKPPPSSASSNSRH